jgi:hypothetical protein
VNAPLRLATAAITLLLGCGRPPPSGDAGAAEPPSFENGQRDSDDAGVGDPLPPPVHVGRAKAGGCSTPDGSRVRIDISTHNISPAGCASFNFYRDDSGVPGLFPRVKPPRGYVLREARYWHDCVFEQPDGTLRISNTQPVRDADFGFEFVFVFEGKPRSFMLDGGYVVLGQRLLTVPIYYGGTPANCPNR